MAFEFIDNSVAIDRVARRRIRTHAATGKNANRTLARSSKAVVLKKDNSATPFRAPASIRKARRSTSDRASDAEVVEIERPVSDGVLFPIPVPARSRGLVREGVYLSHTILAHCRENKKVDAVYFIEALFFFSSARYNPELDGALEMPDHMGSVWVRYFFLDEACALPLFQYKHVILRYDSYSCGDRGRLPLFSGNNDPLLQEPRQ